MTFVPMFHALHACTFVERPFDVTASTLQTLNRLYPMPDHLHRAVLKRQVEFMAGRICAQQAIEALTGQKPDDIPAQPDRAPGWPPGIVGAITHTTHYAAALVASDRHYQGIGIDCEGIVSAANLNLQRHICRPQELDALQAAQPEWSPEHLLTLVFSAKESLFKCLYPQVGQFFGFAAARVIDLDPRHETFVIQLEETLTPELQTGSQWTGRFGRRDQQLMTAILYPRNAP
jgi:enterobactin synthetase component D